MDYLATHPAITERQNVLAGRGRFLSLSSRLLQHGGVVAYTADLTLPYYVPVRAPRVQCLLSWMPNAMDIETTFIIREKHCTTEYVPRPLFPANQSPDTDTLH